MEEAKNENKINKKPNKTFKKSNTLLIRKRSIDQKIFQKKYEKTFPKQRIIKSRDKEIIKRGNIFPTIKKSLIKTNDKKNIIKNPNIKMINEENKNHFVLPNFCHKKAINNNLNDKNNNINISFYRKNLKYFL